MPIKKEDIEEDDDLWTRRINAFWDGAYKLAQILGPLLTALVVYLQYQSKVEITDKIDTAKTSIKHNIDTANSAVKKDLQEHESDLNEIKSTTAETNAVTLKWRAEHTGKESDIDQSRIAEEKQEATSSKSLQSTSKQP